jgi:hypothetical protein
MAGAPIALQQSADPHWLLTAESQGWSVSRHGVLHTIPLNADGSIGPHVQLDAFEWVDIGVFGIDFTESAVAQLADQIAARGSSLYAYALFSQDRFNALGIRVTSYRLLLAHSQVQLLGWAVAILAAAFAAVIFIQYMTTGHSAAVDDLKNLWGSGVAAVGSAAGTVGQAIATPYIVATLAAGAIAIAVAQISKSRDLKGVRSPNVGPPRGSFSVRSGGASARIGS